MANWLTITLRQDNSFKSPSQYFWREADFAPNAVSYRILVKIPLKFLITSTIICLGRMIVIERLDNKFSGFMRRRGFH